MRIRLRPPWSRRDPVAEVLDVIREARILESEGHQLSPMHRLMVRQAEEVIEQHQRHEDEKAMLAAELAGDESGW